MHPLVKGAAAVAVLTALGSLDPGPAPPPVVVAPAQARGVDGLPALCGPGSLPEGPVCVRIPADDAPQRADLGRERVAQESIPRRPDRPADPARYRYPGDAPRVLGGFDVGAAPQGIRLAVAPAEQIKLLALEHQEGPAEVVATSDNQGAAWVATYHLVREGERERAHLVILRDLDRLEPGVVKGATLAPGAPLGVVRSSGPAEISLEARQMREATARGKRGLMDDKRLTDPAVAIPIDLRNVLPLL